MSNTVVFFGKNNDFSDGGDLGQNAVQLKPQRIKIKLIPSKWTNKTTSKKQSKPSNTLLQVDTLNVLC